MACDRCDEYRSRNFRFCPVCGEGLVKKKDGLETVLNILAGIVVTVLSFILLFELGTAIGNVEYVLGNLDSLKNNIFIIVPTIVTLFTIDGIALKIFYILLLVTVIASVAFIAYRSLPKIVEGRKEMRDTPLAETLVLFASLYLLEFIFVLILQAAGVDIEGLPERPDYEWMFDLLQASVWEEVITRILFLGLPVTIIYLVTKKEGATWKNIFGGCGFNKITLIFILFSAFMFGAGHLTNWGSWKFFTTFAFGLIAGYLFCKYGVYATITFHFLTDYIQSEDWVFGTGTVFTGLLIMLTSLCAAPFIWVYLKKGFDYLKTEFSHDSSEESND